MDPSTLGCIQVADDILIIRYSVCKRTIQRLILSSLVLIIRFGYLRKSGLYTNSKSSLQSPLPKTKKEAMQLLS